jgi:hypothetical protein
VDLQTVGRVDPARFGAYAVSLPLERTSLAENADGQDAAGQAPGYARTSSVTESVSLSFQDLRANRALARVPAQGAVFVHGMETLERILRESAARPGKRFLMGFELDAWSHLPQVGATLANRGRLPGTFCEKLFHEVRWTVDDAPRHILEEEGAAGARSRCTFRGVVSARTAEPLRYGTAGTLVLNLDEEELLKRLQLLPTMLRTIQGAFARSQDKAQRAFEESSRGVQQAIRSQMEGSGSLGDALVQQLERSRELLEQLPAAERAGDAAAGTPESARSASPPASPPARSDSQSGDVAPDMQRLARIGELMQRIGRLGHAEREAAAEIIERMGPTEAAVQALEKLLEVEEESGEDR